MHRSNATLSWWVLLPKTTISAREARSMTVLGVLSAALVTKTMRPTHAHWDAWLKHVVGYAVATYQVLPVSETMSVTERNNRVTRTKKGKAGRIPLVPKSWDTFQYAYICTPGWKGREGKSRSKGSVRRYTGCPFRFVAQVKPSAADGWQAQVKMGRFVHNHTDNTKTYATYRCR
ncbi:hypothetical protein BBJ28_00026602 [Nothophytophthora sp. Chile5]|nr:hypothetical protein BBJ28_00026602 [Nothophytophthora sp. Chile5]